MTPSSLAASVGIVLGLACGAAHAQAYPPWSLSPDVPMVPALDTFNMLRGMNFTTVAITIDGQVMMGPASRCVPPIPPKQTTPPDLNGPAAEILQARGLPGAAAPRFPPISLVDHCYPFPTRTKGSVGDASGR